MKLYYYPGACSLADHIVLEWTGLEYEAVRVTAQGMKSDEYLRMNPHGQVPLLVDGDFTLTENVAILTYLAELAPGSGLLGDGSFQGKAEVMRWLAHLNSDVHGAFKPYFAPSRFLVDKAQAEALALQAQVVVMMYMERLDKHLTSRDWLAGNSKSIADPYLFVMLRWAKGMGAQDLRHLAKFHDRMLTDAGVIAALTEEEHGRR